MADAVLKPSVLEISSKEAGSLVILVQTFNDRLNTVLGLFRASLRISHIVTCLVIMIPRHVIFLGGNVAIVVVSTPEYVNIELSSILDNSYRSIPKLSYTNERSTVQHFEHRQCNMIGTPEK